MVGPNELTFFRNDKHMFIDHIDTEKGGKNFSKYCY